MTPLDGARRPGSPGALINALAWRSRREGLRYLLVTFAPFAALVTLLMVLSSYQAGRINGAASFAVFGARYGAHTDAMTVGLGLLLGPGLVALFSAISVAALVRNLIGSEASRGGIEALLAAPYRPGIIMTALLGYVGLLATFYWAGMAAIMTAALAAATAVSGTAVSLTGSYILAALILPLLAAWAAAALALLVNLIFPRLAQAGSFGLNLGGGLGNAPALLPGLAVLFVFLLWAPRISAGELLTVAGGAVAALTVGSVIAVARHFRPEEVLAA